MNAVGPVHVSEAGRTEHHRVARGLASVGMRRRVGVVIGLDLDDHSAGAIEQKHRADQVGRDLMHRAVEERAGQFTGHAITYRELGVKGEGIAHTRLPDS